MKHPAGSPRVEEGPGRLRRGLSLGTLGGRGPGQQLCWLVQPWADSFAWASGWGRGPLSSWGHKPWGRGHKGDPQCSKARPPSPFPEHPQTQPAALQTPQITRKHHRCPPSWRGGRANSGPLPFLLCPNPPAGSPHAPKPTLTAHLGSEEEAPGTGSFPGILPLQRIREAELRGGAPLDPANGCPQRWGPRPKLGGRVVNSAGLGAPGNPARRGAEAELLCLRPASRCSPRRGGRTGPARPPGGALPARGEAASALSQSASSGRGTNAPRANGNLR